MSKIADEIKHFACLTHRVSRLTIRPGLPTCISCPKFLKKLLEICGKNPESFVFHLRAKIAHGAKRRSFGTTPSQKFGTSGADK